MRADRPVGLFLEGNHVARGVHLLESGVTDGGVLHATPALRYPEIATVLLGTLDCNSVLRLMRCQQHVLERICRPVIEEWDKARKVAAHIERTWQSGKATANGRFHPGKFTYYVDVYNTWTCCGNYSYD